MLHRDALVGGVGGAPVAVGVKAGEAVDAVADLAVIAGVGAAQHIAGDGDDAGVVLLADRLDEVVPLSVQLGSGGRVAAL